MSARGKGDGMTNSFQRDLVRGSLDLIVLSVLADEPKYGYAIQKLVVDATGNQIKLPAGTLYPLLHRLEADRLIRAKWELADGRRRKYYSLTAKGVKQLNKQGAEWNRYAQCIKLLLNRALKTVPYPA
jgi:DNA-binding PadR family transcriptional regulator